MADTGPPSQLFGGRVARSTPPAKASERDEPCAAPRPAIFLPRILDDETRPFDRLAAELGSQLLPLPFESEFSAWQTLPVSYGLGGEVVRIKKAANAAGAETVDLFGVGAGAAMAIAFAMRYPGRVASLALFEPIVLGWVAGDIDIVERDETVLGALRAPESSPLEILVGYALSPEVVGEELRKLRKFEAENVPATAKARQFLVALTEYPVAPDLLGELRAPVLVGWGDLAHPLWIRGLRAIARWFPNVRTREFARCHLLNHPYLVDPSSVADELRRLWGTERPPHAHPRVQKSGGM